MLLSPSLAQSPSPAVGPPPPAPAPTRPYARPIDPDEAAVTALAQVGNRDAFGCLYQLYFDQIYNYLYRMVGVRADAEEMAQTAFLKASQKIGETEDGLRFGAWIYRVAHNVALDELRHRKLWRMERIEPYVQTNWCHPALIAGDTPEHDALSAETEREVRRILDSLRPIYRAVMVLRHYHDLDYDGIAAVLGGGTTRAAVKSLLFRARRTFRAAWVKKQAPIALAERTCAICAVFFRPKQRTQLTCCRACQQERKRHVNHRMRRQRAMAVLP